MSWDQLQAKEVIKRSSESIYSEGRIACKVGNLVVSNRFFKWQGCARLCTYRRFHSTCQVQGIRVEVEIGGLQTWSDSAELDAILAPLTLASSRKLSTEDLIRDDSIAEERCKIAFAAVQV